MFFKNDNVLILVIVDSTHKTKSITTRLFLFY